MLVITLTIAAILLFVNYVPIWLMVSANRYNYFQGIVFGLLFVGIWAYKIQVETELQSSKVMDLKESIFRSTNRSKARMRLRYHDPWEYVFVDMKKFDNAMEDKREKSALLLRTLSVDALLVLGLAIRGRKMYRKQYDYYSRNIKVYSIFTVFCILVEILNYYYLDL